MVRVAVGDSGSAQELLELLVAQFGADAVSVDADGRQVCVEPRGNPDRALVRALDVLFDWVDGCDGPAKLDIDGRSYMLGPPERIGGLR